VAALVGEGGQTSGRDRSGGGIHDAASGASFTPIRRVGGTPSEGIAVPPQHRRPSGESTATELASSSSAATQDTAEPRRIREISTDGVGDSPEGPLRNRGNTA
jgi:hypothetical protein